MCGSVSDNLNGLWRRRTSAEMRKIIRQMYIITYIRSDWTERVVRSGEPRVIRKIHEIVPAGRKPPGRP